MPHAAGRLAMVAVLVVAGARCVHQLPRGRTLGRGGGESRAVRRRLARFISRGVFRTRPAVWVQIGRRNQQGRSHWPGMPRCPHDRGEASTTVRDQDRRFVACRNSLVQRRHAVLQYERRTWRMGRPSIFWARVGPTLLPVLWTWTVAPRHEQVSSHRRIIFAMLRPRGWVLADPEAIRSAWWLTAAAECVRSCYDDPGQVVKGCPALTSQSHRPQRMIVAEAQPKPNETRSWASRSHALTDVDHRRSDTRRQTPGPPGVGPSARLPG